jgi:hypothetical protein
MRSYKTNPIVIKKVEERLLDGKKTTALARDNIVRLFAILQQSFTKYDKDINTIRKYYLKYHKEEYRLILSSIRRQRLIDKVSFSSKSSWNVNDNLKQFRWKI